jgi:hypothetical protein
MVIHITILFKNLTRKSKIYTKKTKNVLLVNANIRFNFLALVLISVATNCNLSFNLDKNQLKLNYSD